MTTGFDTALRVCNYAASLPRWRYIVKADPDHDVDDVAQVQGDGQLVAGGPRPVEHRGEESAAEFARCPGGNLVVVVVVVVVTVDRKSGIKITYKVRQDLNTINNGQRPKFC